MKEEVVDSVAHFPPSQDGEDRKQCMSNVEARIRYWEAVRLEARTARNRSLTRVATGLVRSYEAKRREMKKSEQVGAAQDVFSIRRVPITG
jgi:hypothetical protein